jgi:CRISPR/Cas system-associated exonuclease Cas4 (RecB family)
MLRRPVTAGVLYYCTQRGNYKQVEIAISEQARSDTAAILATINASIAEGFLPAAPRKDACEFCDYRPVCGPYEELRVTRKRKDRLEKLFQVRMMP